METEPAATVVVSKPAAGQRWEFVAALLWAVVLVVILVRAGLHPARASSLTTYLKGGMAWKNGQPVYTDWRGFVYPPLIAWIFSLTTYLPTAAAAVLWRFVTACGFILGLRALVESGVCHRVAAGFRGVVYIAALPLAIGNIDNAQANPLIAGLLMLSVAACDRGEWNACAIAAGFAIIFKVYPLALAMLLCVLRPRPLIWRMALVVAVLAVLPFLGQDRHFVMAQYQTWLHGRVADNRFTYPMKDAPLDLWYLLVRLWNLPFSSTLYEALQLGSGALLAALVWLRAKQGLALRDNIESLFLLVSVWMLLLGPATENQTYIILAPATCIALVRAFNAGTPPAARLFAWVAYALLLFAVARNSLLPHLKSPGWMAIQPIGAIFLLATVLLILPKVTPASPR